MIRDLVKAHLSQSLQRAVRSAMDEYQLQRRHHASLGRARKYAGRRDLKLNLGCGSHIRPGWVNIDLWDPKAELRLDLREPFPFADGAATFVYSEHIFEHFGYPEDALRFLGESLRVLSPGGRFSVGVPDTEWPLRAYVTNDEEYFRLARERWHPTSCTTRMHQVNYHFRQGGEHRYAYDYETLAQVLENAGFTAIHRREFDLTLDSEDRRVGTLYVDAEKPARTRAS